MNQLWKLIWKRNFKFSLQIMRYEQKEKTQQQTFKSKSIPDSGIEPGTSRISVESVTSGHTRQLNTQQFIVVKLFICFNVKGQSINKQSQLCTSHLSTKLFYVICMYNYIWQFFIFTG